jgi:hypothetical protein
LAGIFAEPFSNLTDFNRRDSRHVARLGIARQVDDVAPSIRSGAGCFNPANDAWRYRDQVTDRRWDLDFSHACLSTDLDDRIDNTCSGKGIGETFEEQTVANPAPVQRGVELTVRTNHNKRLFGIRKYSPVAGLRWRAADMIRQ